MHDEWRVSHPDVLVNNVGTLYTSCRLTLRAKEWIDEHVEDDAQWFGHALVVEHRYVRTGSGHEGRRAGAEVRKTKGRR